VSKEARRSFRLRHALRQQAPVREEPSEDCAADKGNGVLVRDLELVDKRRGRSAQQIQDDIGNPAPFRDRGFGTHVAQAREHRRPRTVPVFRANPSPPQGLPIEGDAIDPETPRCDNAEIGCVPAHREQPPYQLQLIIILHRIRVDQKHQRRALPFVHGLHHAQRGVAVAACRQQCRVREKLRALIVKRAKCRWISPEFSDRSPYVSHRLRSTALPVRRPR